MNDNEKHREISLADLFRLIFKHWLVLVLITVLCGVFGYVIADNRKTTSYVSSTTFIIRAESKGVSTSGNNSTTTSNPQNDTNHTLTLMPVFVRLMLNEDCLSDIADRLNTDYAGSYENHTAPAVENMVNIAFNEEDLTITVTAYSPINKAHAVDVCKYMSEYGIESIKGFFNDNNGSTNSGTVTISTKTITYPSESTATISTTSVTTYAVLGALVGFVVALIAVIIINTMDTKVSHEEELARKTELPVLSVIPLDALKKTAKKSNVRGAK